MAVGRACGVSYQAVGDWSTVPAKHVAICEQLSGIPAETIRPDVFWPDRVPQTVHGVA